MSLGELKEKPDGFIDVRDIHPDFDTAECKHCETVSYGSASGIQKHGFTFCDDHDPLADSSGMRLWPARGFFDDYVEVPYDQRRDVLAFLFDADRRNAGGRSE